jgi:hypothetical protein
MTTIFFSPLSFVAVFGSEIRDPGSGMGKNQDPGSGINIPDPQHCMDELNFQILGSLRCQGWVVLPKNVKKFKNYCTLYVPVFCSPLEERISPPPPST